MITGIVKLFKQALIASALLTAPPGIAAQQQSLKVYTWPEYIDPVIVGEFEQQYDTHIDFSYFDSDEARDNELASSAGRGYDIVMVNRLQISKYVSHGWLEPLTLEQVPNKRHIDSRWAETLGDVSDYAVANFWGTMGIAYRQDYLPQGIQSWEELLSPDESLRNRIMMPNFARELVALALKSKGRSANTSDKTLIADTLRILLTQKPYIRYYGYPTLDKDSDLVNGKIWAGAFYNGDILKLHEFDDNIHYLIPEEGGLLWIDYLTVAQSSHNKQLAFDFINFLNDPHIAARQAEFVNFATPNAAARELLPESTLLHPVIYPNANIIERSEFLEPLPPRSQKHINTIGSQLLY